MTQPDGLIALAIQNGALDAHGLPQRIKLLNWGSNPSLKGDIIVGDATLDALPGNQELYGFDKIGIDYEHQSVEGHKNFKPAPRDYAAYGVPEIIPGDGLYLTALTWTPSGQANAKNYCDLSPVVLRKDGQVIFLHSVALCPQGAVKNLEFFTADFQPTTTTTQPMNPDLQKLLTSLFGVADDADEAAILEAGQTFAKQIAEMNKPGDKKDEAADLDALTARIDALAAQFDATRRDEILAAAAREGKLVPASAKDLPLDKLSALAAELPVTVPVERRTPAAVQTSKTETLSATDRAVCDQLGLKPETFLA